VIAHPRSQFLLSSTKREVKKKHNCIDPSFSCFPAHVNEPDRFMPFTIGWQDSVLPSFGDGEPKKSVVRNAV
jgi:hypothetical protein